MSITKMTNNPTKSARIQAALSLANTVQRQRQNLGMSVERAAGLAGMQVSEWCALEAGWVPHTPGVLRAVADTLELGYSQLSFLAEISEFNQIDPAQNLSLGVVLINIYAHLRGRPARKRR